MLSKRIHGMDALRAIAMLLGIVLHAAIPYRIFTNANWPSDPAFQTIGFDALYIWIHSFRMQLFFLVAGFFARLLYLKIGQEKFIQHRLKRILLPFVVSIIVIIPLSLAPLLYYKFMFLQELSAYEAVLQTFSAIKQWNGLVHLWFLYYLMMFYGCMLTLQIVIPAELRSSILSKLTVLANLTNPLVFVGVAFFLYFILQINNLILIEPHTGLRPAIGQFVYYGIFFLVGYLLHTKSQVIEQFKRYSVLFFLTGGILVIPFTYLYFIVSTTDASPQTYWVARAIGVCQTLLLVGGSLGGFVRFFSSENKTIRYISDAAYWLYLAHFPIVTCMEVALLSSSVYGWLRFWVVLIITSIVTLLTYHYIVRYTIIGTVLHGKRIRENQEEILKASTAN